MYAKCKEDLSFVKIFETRSTEVQAAAGSVMGRGKSVEIQALPSHIDQPVDGYRDVQKRW